MGNTMLGLNLFTLGVKILLFVPCSHKHILVSYNHFPQRDTRWSIILLWCLNSLLLTDQRHGVYDFKFQSDIHAVLHHVTLIPIQVGIHHFDIQQYFSSCCFFFLTEKKSLTGECRSVMMTDSMSHLILHSNTLKFCKTLTHPCLEKNRLLFKPSPRHGKVKSSVSPLDGIVIYQVSRDILSNKYKAERK